jgi:hypothetical protein
MIRIIFKKIFFVISFAVSLKANAQSKVLIINDFESGPIPKVPNFEDKTNWAALPTLRDMADQIPQSKINLSDNQDDAAADVFYIYPTIYTQLPENEYTWNASVEDKKLNSKIDNSAIKNQATAFNESCKVYAPRYRQAHYSVFLTKDSVSAKKALDLAYSDVKSAFEYYLSHFNQNRPIVIAAHSQGTLHAIRLLQEFFDDKPLQNRLVTAYLVGMPVNDSLFKSIKLTAKSDEVGKYVSWNTFANGYIPDYYKNGLHKAQLVNPINWTNDTAFTDYSLHRGTVGLKFKISPKIVSARTSGGLLWIKKPKVFGKAMIKTKIWHFADYNLFWMDIRENVALRVKNFID